MSTDREGAAPPLRSLVAGYDICDNCGAADMEWGCQVRSGRFEAVICQACADAAVRYGHCEHCRDGCDAGHVEPCLTFPFSDCPDGQIPIASVPVPTATEDTA